MADLYLTEKSSALDALRRTGLIHKDALAHSASGHLLNTQYPGQIKDEWNGFDPDILPILIDRIPLTPTKSRDGKSYADRLRAIAADMKRADRVIIATDAGREGSLIGWEILWDYAGLGRDLSRVQRLHLTATTETGIKAAFAKMAANTNGSVEDYAAYQEGRMRQLEDWLFGMNGSILLNHYVKPSAIRTAWGYGPVQLGLLALLHDREIEISQFQPEEYFHIIMTVKTNLGVVQLVHQPKPILKDEEGAQRLATLANAWSGKLSVKSQKVTRKPPELFNGNKLAKIAAKAFGWKPDYTESVNQKLYERGLLSYPRTESNKLPSDQAPLAPAVLRAIAKTLPDLAGLIPASPVIRTKSHYVPDPGEHHAIVPTDEAATDLSGDERRLYERIARGFLAAHLPDAVFNETVISATVLDPSDSQSRFVFQTKGLVEVDPGWKVALVQERGADTLAGKQKEEDDSDAALPPIVDGTDGAATEAGCKALFTKAPPRITLGGLGGFASRLTEFLADKALKAALIDPAKPDEPRGLGTIASLKGIIPHLFNRHWIEQRGAGKDPALAGTALGQALILYLRDNYPRHAYAAQRALFEQRLQRIGKAKTKAACDALVSDFITETHDAVLEMIAALKDKAPLQIDPSAYTASAPSPAMKKAVESTAARLSVPIPQGALKDYGIAKAFLDQHASDPTPSGAQVKLAQSLAERLGEAVPEDAVKDRVLLKTWIDTAMKRAPPRLATEPQLTLLRKVIEEGKVAAGDIAGWPNAVSMEEASKHLNKHLAGKSKKAGGKANAKRRGGSKAMFQKKG